MRDSLAWAQAGLARVLESEGRYGEALVIWERLRDQNLVARLAGKS